MSPTPLKLGILVSGSGTNLQSIIDAISSKQLQATIQVVISNRPHVQALERAQRFGVPAQVISHRKYPARESFEEALSSTLLQHQAEWIVLAGFMRVLTSHFLSVFPGRVVNIHPSLLPAFPGINAQQQAFEHGVKFSGCTVHFVDEGTDTGPIIGQAVIPILESDTVEDVRQRILEQEHRLYPRILQLIAQNQVVRHGRKVQITDNPLNNSPLISLANPVFHLK